jgi:hypothetical protein
MVARLAENPAVSVLLLEAGGNADLTSITDGRQSASNIKAERDRNFQVIGVDCGASAW